VKGLIWQTQLMESNRSLLSVYRGWEGYQLSLVDAIAPLTRDQLRYRPAPRLRSVGETAGHIGEGRFDWLKGILSDDAPRLVQEVEALKPATSYDENAGELVGLLEDTWRLIDHILMNWTADDLESSLVLPYEGKSYRVPYQWVVWRILTHDVHHGGEISLALGLQDIPVPKLGDLGGHLTEVPEA
jgi:uncharacterized damage-inducible protein DinB